MALRRVWEALALYPVIAYIIRLAQLLGFVKGRRLEVIPPGPPVLNHPYPWHLGHYRLRDPPLRTSTTHQSKAKPRKLTDRNSTLRAAVPIFRPIADLGFPLFVAHRLPQDMLDPPPIVHACTGGSLICESNPRARTKFVCFEGSFCIDSPSRSCVARFCIRVNEHAEKSNQSVCPCPRNFPACLLA